MFIKHESKYVKKINYRNWFMAYRIHIYKKKKLSLNESKEKKLNLCQDRKNRTQV